MTHLIPSDDRRITHVATASISEVANRIFSSISGVRKPVDAAHTVLSC
jgi:hypothetical protein